MFITTFSQKIAAAVAAIVLSTTFLSTAVGPVHASQIAQIQISAEAHA